MLYAYDFKGKKCSFGKKRCIKARFLSCESITYSIFTFLKTPKSQAKCLLDALVFHFLLYFEQKPIIFNQFY